jgi:hypothetical protein
MRTLTAIIAFLLIPFISACAQSTVIQKLMDEGVYPKEGITSEIDYIDTSLIEINTLSLEDINDDF